MHKLNKIDPLHGRVTEKKFWYSLVEYINFLRHKKAYLFACEYCKDKTVLDFGCGSGYGVYLLSLISEEAFGVDTDKNVISECVKKYKRNNLSFLIIESKKKTKFKDHFFDVITSFQVIEHIQDVARYLIEFKRILKEDGVIFITTPNRKYRLLPFQKPWNPDHIREYNLKALKRELDLFFKNVEILGIRGIKEINDTEKKRVRQTALKALILKPLKKMMRYDVSQFLKKNFFYQKEKKCKPIIKSQILQKYSMNDFFVDKENLNDCLDFIAICQK